MRTGDETLLYKALMHPARLAILDELRQGEACVCHLEAQLGLRQAYVSQQLMVLREAGLVIDRRQGLNAFYAVADERVFNLMDLARGMAGHAHWPRPDVVRCPCPHCQSVVPVSEL
jgi:ArsR family transcriptional regulator